MRLYNTLSREVEEIVPVEDAHVRMYTCGPTVYRYAHLGNLRTFMLADLIRRALDVRGLSRHPGHEHHGCRAHDGRVQPRGHRQDAAGDGGRGPHADGDRGEVHGRRVRRRRRRSASGRPTSTPRPPSTSPRCSALTETLVSRGHAYVVDSGSVYYDVTSFPGYGKLSGNTLDNLREGHRDLETDDAQEEPGGLRALEGRRPRPRHEVGVALGRWLPQAGTWSAPRCR